MSNIGETFTVNGKTYTIKNSLKFGHNRKITEIGQRLQDIQEEFFPNIDKIDAEAIGALDEKRYKEYQKKQTPIINQNFQLMANILETVLGLTQDEIDDLDDSEANDIINKLIIMSAPKKKLEKQ